MPQYHDLIRRHASEFDRLHKEIHRTFAVRDSRTGHEAWKRATKAFHSYQSPLHDWINEIENRDLCDWPDGRTFVFAYFEVDPMYFRSGYLKERLVQKIKPCDLPELERNIIRRLIVRRIKTHALRDFRQFCQLILMIQDDAFVKELGTLATDPDEWIATRASFALRYVIRVD